MKRDEFRTARISVEEVYDLQKAMKTLERKKMGERPQSGSTLSETTKKGEQPNSTNRQHISDQLQIQPRDRKGRSTGTANDGHPFRKDGGRLTETSARSAIHVACLALRVSNKAFVSMWRAKQRSLTFQNPAESIISKAQKH